MGLRISLIVTITIIFLCWLYLAIEPFTYVEIPPADGIDLVKIDQEQKDQDCSKYIEFMKQPINQAYYQYPRFLNPKESCQHQCRSGIWYDGLDFGTKVCCQKACDVIKKGGFE